MPRVMPVVSLIAVGAMCRWMSVKVMFLGVVAGLGRKLGLRPLRVTTTPSGAVLLLAGVSL
jgi:hypothetical protein